MKCIVKDCANHNDHGGFTGNLCNPCYQFITAGKGKYSQAYRNTRPVELTDEEILNIAHQIRLIDRQTADDGHLYFARAIMKRCGIISGTDK